MSVGKEGLNAFTENNRSITDCDLVTWHTVGLTHVPRPEDWPVMPIEFARFMLVPNGFFDGNPTLDLPANANKQSKL
jgi:primary-amine oxidase